MEEAELLNQARLSQDWVDEFVVESNKIDPQGQPDGPGTVLYDGHREAVLYAIRMASEDRYALPHAVHKLLLRDDPLAEQVRRRDVKIGLNHVLEASHVPRLFWQWNRRTHETIDSLRVDDDSVDPGHAIAEVLGLHAMFENIHPYEVYNGKVGRVLMVNHALLVDVEPWIIPCDLGREDYFDMIRHHPSAQWGIDPPDSISE